jgi:hypothetical protein
LKKNNLTEAHKYADILLRLNENNEEAIKLLVSIINAKKSNEFTINYLENIIEKQPLGFKLIEIYIDIVTQLLQRTFIKIHWGNKCKYIYLILSINKLLESIIRILKIKN